MKWCKMLYTFKNRKGKFLMKIVKAVILIISVFFIGCNATTLPEEGEDEMNKALLEES